MFQSPENLIFNGVDIQDYLSQYFDGGYFLINEVRGRGILKADTVTIEIPGKHGAVLVDKKYPPRPIEVDFTLRGTSLIDVRKRLNVLHALLQTKDDVPFSFADEPNMIFYGTLSGVSEGIETDTIHKSTFTLECNNPFKYEQPITKVIQTEGEFLNTGTEESFPIIKIEVPLSTARLDIYVNNRIFTIDTEINYPVSIDSQSFDAFVGETLVIDKIKGYWPILRPGINTIKTNVESNITIIWNPCYY